MIFAGARPIRVTRHATPKAPRQTPKIRTPEKTGREGNKADEKGKATRKRGSVEGPTLPGRLNHDASAVSEVALSFLFCSSATGPAAGFRLHIKASLLISARHSSPARVSEERAACLQVPPAQACGPPNIEISAGESRKKMKKMHLMAKKPEKPCFSRKNLGNRGFFPTFKQAIFTSISTKNNKIPAPNPSPAQKARRQWHSPGDPVSG